MRTSRRTETMIALRAAKQAVHMARDVMYDRVAFEEVSCPICGGIAFRPEQPPDAQAICKTCGLKMWGPQAQPVVRVPREPWDDEVPPVPTDERLPAEKLSWHDAASFLIWLVFTSFVIWKIARFLR